MSQYYCHKCGVTFGIIPGNIEDFNPTGNTYQLDKFYKHTVPPINNPNIISVFDLSDENKGYKDYLVNTLASGCIEIDDRGRINVVWVAGKTTGWEYHNSNFRCDDAVKVVLHDNEVKIHGYPTGSASLSSQKCINCDDNIVNPDD